MWRACRCPSSQNQEGFSVGGTWGGGGELLGESQDGTSVGGPALRPEPGDRNE